MVSLIVSSHCRVKNALVFLAFTFDVPVLVCRRTQEGQELLGSQVAHKHWKNKAHLLTKSPVMNLGSLVFFAQDSLGTSVENFLANNPSLTALNPDREFLYLAPSCLIRAVRSSLNDDEPSVSEKIVSAFHERKIQIRCIGEFNFQVDAQKALRDSSASVSANSSPSAELLELVSPSSVASSSSAAVASAAVTPVVDEQEQALAGYCRGIIARSY